MEHCLQRLKAANFRYAGRWALRDDQPVFECDAPETPGVYVFVVNGDVRYVGAAQRSLGGRLNNYERKQRRFRERPDPRPVHRHLNDAINAGAEVQIFILPAEPHTWRDLPINLTAGVEAGLIETFNPRWNVLGVRQVAA